MFPPKRVKVSRRSGRPTNATAATPSAVEVHVSLVGRKYLTGQIYRQLRRPSSAGANLSPERLAEPPS